MSAMFTQHALEGMRERDVTQDDIAGLLATVERVADDPSELARSREVLRVKQRQGDDAFIVRVGNMRAVVAVDPAVRGQVLVLNVYRADQDPAAYRRSAEAEDSLARAR